MKILSGKLAKQTCGSRLGSVCGSRTEAMQKNPNIFNALAAVIRKLKVMRPSIAERLCSPDLTLVLAVYLPIWHSYCTKARFTILASCSDEIAVHSCPLFFLQRQVAKLARGLYYIISLYCVTITWQQIFKGLFQIMVEVKAFCRMWLLNTDILASNAARQRLLLAQRHVIW